MTTTVHPIFTQLRIVDGSAVVEYCDADGVWAPLKNVTAFAQADGSRACRMADGRLIRWPAATCAAPAAR